MDEYLQAAILSVDRSHVEVSLRMAPGVAVAPIVIAAIDRDHNGSISDTEAAAYVQRVLSDLSLRADGEPLSMHPLSSIFPTTGELNAGLGEIQMTFLSNLPSGQAGSSHTDRTLTFENRHMPALSVYMVNALVPSDTAIAIQRQARNLSQSTFELAFTDTAPVLDPSVPRWRGTQWRVLAIVTAAALILAGLLIRYQPEPSES